MPSPEVRARLLDTAHDPPRPSMGDFRPRELHHLMLAWQTRADARAAVLREAVEVLEDLGLGVDCFLMSDRELSPELALLLAAEHRRTDGPAAGDETVEDYLWSMEESGLRVRGCGDG